MTGDGAIAAVSKYKANPDFSLRPDPARYRSRFCTKRFVGSKATDSKLLLGQSRL